MTISDIITKLYLYTNTNSTSLSSANALILVNNAYEKVISKIISSDNAWQWDDNNQTDLPIATTSIVSGQADYSLTVDHLKIFRVEIATSSAVTSWKVLESYDYRDETESFSQRALSSGIPDRYDKLGQSIFLDLKPSYSATNGLKIYFERGPALFTSGEVSTGTKKPGFNSLYHELIPLWASYDYLVAKGLPNANQIFIEIDRREKAMMEDYHRRDANYRDVMTTKSINFR